MRLCPLEPTSRLATNISSLSRRLNLRVVVKGAREWYGLLVMADGTPDDLVSTLLAYHIDGEEVMWITKPKVERGPSVIDLIPEYLELKMKARNIMVLMDQEDKAVNEVFEETSERLREIAEPRVEAEERLRVYSCMRGEKGFKLILIVSGRLGGVKSHQHSGQRGHLAGLGDKILYFSTLLIGVDCLGG